MATLGFIVTLGVDLFSFSAASSALRAAAPAEEMALEAPAAQALPPSDAVGGAVPEAATPILGAEVQLDSLQATPPPAPTATGPAAPTESANRVAPVLEAGASTAVPTAEVAAPPPAAESGVMTAPACEACSGDQPLPPETPYEKAAGEAPTSVSAPTVEPGAAVAAAEAATPETFALRSPPAPEATSAVPPAGLSWLRWLEIGLAGMAMLLAGLTLRARHKSP